MCLTLWGLRVGLMLDSIYNSIWLQYYDLIVTPRNASYLPNGNSYLTLSADILQPFMYSIPHIVWCGHLSYILKYT